MAQASSKLFDNVGRLMNDAAGMADGVRREVESMVRAQAERFIMDMNLVKREDYDALRELVQRQSEGVERAQGRGRGDEGWSRQGTGTHLRGSRCLTAGRSIHSADCANPSSGARATLSCRGEGRPDCTRCGPTVTM